jgi:SAM-dependent methyltransferase
MVHPAPRCPVCASAHGTKLLSRAGAPVHQNVLHRSAGEARSTARGDIDLMCCGACGFVWNASFDVALMNYGEEYENSQERSARFETHLDELVASLGPLDGRTVVEVGCGNGSFLRRVLDRHPTARGVGFDPAYRGEPVALDGRLRFRTAFYGPETAPCAPAADVVLSRHVIEHLEDPVELLRLVRAALQDNVDARVFLETPCIEWIFDHVVVWDIFYEHCSLFTLTSLVEAGRRAGFGAVSAGHTFGGQYLWVELSPRVFDEQAEPHRRPETLAKGLRYAEKEAATLSALNARIAGEIAPHALWGAGAKGVTMANLLDPDARIFSEVIDINPLKQGHYLPGTGHPIVGADALAMNGTRTAFLLNPNYRNECAEIIRRNGGRVALVDLMDEQA